MRIIFAGTPEYAMPSLKQLYASQHQIIAVLTQPDRPAGRGRKKQSSPVKQWAQSQHLTVYEPQSLRDSNVQHQLTQLNPDLIVVAAYGLLLPKTILTLPKWGCINVHASLLPRWRGASPIQHAILAGDRETGITIMQMTEGLDEGPILLQKTCEIAEQETAETLHDKLAELGAKALMEVLVKLEQGGLHPEPQNDQQATYAPKINKEAAEIDWQQPAIQIERRVRAYNPWPVAYSHFQGERIRIWEAQAMETAASASPGTIEAVGGDWIDVATEQGRLRIYTIQRPGGRPMSIRDWLNAESIAKQVQGKQAKFN